MRFPLRILEGGKLELDTYAVCGQTKKSGTVTFLIDTGAEISSIGAKDIKGLGLTSKDLQKYTGKRIVGIGGKSRTLVVPDVTIILRSEKGSEEFLPNHDFVYHRAFKEKKRRTKRGLTYDDVAIFRAPSIFGTDLMRKMGMTLHYDTKKGIAYFEC